MLDIQNKLDEVLKKSNSLPFLFVGSGISRRYLDLPNWAELLEKFSDETEYYLQKYNEDYPKVASVIEEEFFEEFWNDNKYQELKKQYLRTNLKGQEFPLKFAIADFFKKIDYEKYKLKDEVEEFKKINVDGFISTNYDKFLETLFDFKVYQGQYDLLFNKTMEIGEIYKIHGCCDKFETIVITEQDYQKFKKQNIYLTAKLTSLFIEHPIVFLGYSLSDENIVGILDNIASSIGEKHLQKLNDRIIFIEYEQDSSKQIFEKSTKTINDLIIPITLIRTDDFLSVYKTLSATKRKIPAKCLRMMENSIYELVKTNDPKGKMAVVDIDRIDDYTDIEFYAGVGVVNEMSNKGYNCIESIDLFEDLIFDENNYKFPENIINKILPKLFGQNTYLPIFKYLKELKIDNLKYKEEQLHKKIIDIINFKNDNYKYKSNLKYFEEDETFIKNIFKYLDSDDQEKINLEKLQNFLKENKSILNNEKHVNEKTDYKRLACLYDRLQYGWFE